MSSPNRICTNLMGGMTELRVFTRIVFNRLGDGQLFTFMPHIKGDPE